MPPIRRIDKHRPELPEEAEDWLRGGDGAPWVYWQSAEDLAALWRENKIEIVAEHIAEMPGSRPARWWEYEAPEPRRRLSGIGAACHKLLASIARFHKGVALDWVDADTIHTYDLLGDPLGVPPLDEADPPMFESEAAFLDRHGLLAAAERRRLTDADFEPVSVLDILDRTDDR